MTLLLNNKTFINCESTANGDVSHETIFHYKQNHLQIEATYSGGSIRVGHIVGVMITTNTFTMVYHHLNKMNELRIDQCHTTITITPNGKIKLIERWQWLNGDGSKGESLLLEI